MQDAEVQFVSAVREFCSWVESPPINTDSDTEARTALYLVARLYVSALAVKQGGCGNDVDEPRLSHEEWKEIYTRFSSLPFNYYNTFFSPAKMMDKEPCVGDLADDFSDIYRDLKQGLDLYGKEHVTEALWEWKQGFRTHWGRHAASAIHALHCYFEDDYGDL